MRATEYKHYRSEKNKAYKPSKNKSTKSRKGFKAFSFVVAVSLATALILPTTTLAPDVDAYEDSKVASYSIGDISEFSSVITDNCVEAATFPTTEQLTVAETKTTEESQKTEKAKSEKTKVKSEKAESNSGAETKSGSNEKSTENTENTLENSVRYSSALISISNPDPNYCPSWVSLSDYDREKLERLVMGEAGILGFEGCALVAQSIRDAMNRSNTTSIDYIINEYLYYGSTEVEPNQDVKNAVSFIFDQNGSAVQHRILCFYTGVSSWHETQNFIIGIGNVRFFDFY